MQLPNRERSKELTANGHCQKNPIRNMFSLGKWQRAVISQLLNTVVQRSVGNAQKLQSDAGDNLTQRELECLICQADNWNPNPKQQA